ncbi:MAG TPA: hypothetical protein PK949_02075 [Dysgonamonadaceae bacterium]|nr:hypothetical protein [Dysgonamonadaceae bacterium]
MKSNLFFSGCFFLCFVVQIFAQDPYPDFPPANVTAEQDRDQMLWQLGLSFPQLPDKVTHYNATILPKLRFEGSDVSFKPKEESNPDGIWTWATGTSSTSQDDFCDVVTVARAEDGLWNNYIQSWEPGGEYFTGSQFYQPLALHDLNGITAENWHIRRNQIFEEVKKIWGTVPPAANNLKITWEVGDTLMDTADNGIPYKQYTLTGIIDTSLYPAVRDIPKLVGILRIPAHSKGKVPIIITFAWNFGARHPASIEEEVWNNFSPLGIGTLAFDYTQLQPDNGKYLTGYLIGLVNRGNWRKPYDWGTLVAWSWGVSRFIDYFESDANKDVDASKIGLTGHSRLGKATLVTMAYEPRISISFPSSSGSLGVVQSRRHWGQDLSNSLWDQEYHWMAGNFMSYMGVDSSSSDGYMPRKVVRMKVDGESLLALCAPRPIFIGSGDFVGDSWVDPYGQYLSCVAASSVYELLGEKGIVMKDSMLWDDKKIPMPLTDKAYLDGDIGYRRHRGGHVASPNYPAFADFINKYWNSNVEY